MKVVLDFLTHMLRHFTIITFFDILDIICLSLVLFVVFQFIKERRAGKLAIGVALLFVFMILCELLNLRSMQYLLSHFFDFGIVVLVVIFQPELRSALEKLGDNSIKGVKGIADTKNSTNTVDMIDTISDAIFDLAKTKTGALIVFERNTKLGDFIISGTIINAQISTFLLRNIFFNKAPLHDGAVIIRDNRIYCAGCLLPLSTNPNIIKDLGTRHRAAIGVSENSDCVAVVVSEETGIVSIANDGHFRRNFTRATMKKKLEEYLLHDKTVSKGKQHGAKIKMNRKKK